jgi:PKD repeat protein
VDGTGVTQLTFNEGVFDAVPVWIQRASSANNDFADATVIATLPFSDAPDVLAADLEAGEPMPSCAFGAAGRTVWYSFTPPQTGWVAARTANEPFAVVAVYRGTALGDLSEVGCRVFGERLVFQAEGNTTYFFQVGGLFGGAGPLEFHVEEIVPPQNDAFVHATSIPALPFDDAIDLAAATTEVGEPTPSCFGVNRTAWYTFTPAQASSISASPFTLNIPVVLAAYRGNELANLTELDCRVGQKVTFQAEAGTAYYFQVGVASVPSFPVAFRLEVTPAPDANFGFSPLDPSMFDVVQFFSFASDPGDVGFGSLEWSFGDGSSGTDCCPTHRYAVDGDYTVQHTATTLDGRTGSRVQTISARTHDVAITRFFAPKSASAGQTRGIVVGIKNRRYPETVEVQLFKSVPGGFEFVGALAQSVPVHAGNRTTDFSFSYTFTAADASVGKVTFKAVAVLAGARDALPADNEAIGAPTRVNR